jgi:hypothetical protein
MDLEDIRKIIIGAIWSCGKGTGLLKLTMGNGAQRACLRFRWFGPGSFQTHIPFILHFIRDNTVVTVKFVNWCTVTVKPKNNPAPVPWGLCDPSPL